MFLGFVIDDELWLLGLFFWWMIEDNVFLYFFYKLYFKNVMEMDVLMIFGRIRIVGSRVCVLKFWRMEEIIEVDKKW